MTKYFLLAIATVLSLSSFSQKGKIRGTVYDDETGEALFNAFVEVIGTNAKNMPI